MKRYVVLWGQNGVSSEFKTMNSAKKFAQNKANQRKQRVEIDHLEGGRSNWSQGHERYISPNKNKSMPKRTVRRTSPRRYGGYGAGGYSVRDLI